MTFEELRKSILVKGPLVGPEEWDLSWRRQLVDNLEILVRQLWQAGIDDIYVDGSFVEDKPHPNDIDGYFVCDPAELPALRARLNEMDPYQVWTWEDDRRTPDRNSAKRQLPMWHQYRVELYPHYAQLGVGVDSFGNPLLLPSAFRLRRYSSPPKGIVKIIRNHPAHAT
jgi:hypothetical protein